MNIVPKLNLNKHPKDCENLSLTLAKNVMISGDMSCITNEPGIENIAGIEAGLNERLSTAWKIVGYIPCNDEVVLFVDGALTGYVDKIIIYLDIEKKIILYTIVLLIGFGLEVELKVHLLTMLKMILLFLLPNMV